MHSTNTLLANSHFRHSIGADFINNILYDETLNASVEKYSFYHQTAFNMRHKVLIALQDLLENNLESLSCVVEFDKTFVLDCYKDGSVSPKAGRNVRKHGENAAKRGISKNISLSVPESSMTTVLLPQQ